MFFATRAQKFIEDNLLFTSLLSITISFAFVGGYALFLQARRADISEEHWKSWFIIGCYGVLALVSLVVIGRRGRILALRLKRVPQREVIASPGVRQFIQDEYWRAAAIAYISLPKGNQRTGWGAPGTPYEGVYFRRAILDTIPAIDLQARAILPSLPALRPHIRMAHQLRTLALLFPQEKLSCLRAYDSAVQFARYSKQEPTEAEFEQGIQAYQTLFGLLAEFRNDEPYINAPPS